VPASRRLLAVLATASVAIAGCAAPADVSDPVTGGGAAADPSAPTAEQPPRATSVRHEEQTGEVALCTVLPRQMVGDLVSAQAVGASGDGSQCTWHLQVPSPADAGGGGADLAATGDATLQGAFLDLGAFRAGRPPAQDLARVAEVAGVGDEAFVVHLGDAAPSTLYVRDGSRALSLWVDDVPMSPEDTERSLARMASLLLDLA